MEFTKGAKIAGVIGLTIVVALGAFFTLFEGEDRPPSIDIVGGKQASIDAGNLVRYSEADVAAYDKCDSKDERAFTKGVNIFYFTEDMKVNTFLSKSIIPTKTLKVDMAIYSAGESAFGKGFNAFNGAIGTDILLKKSDIIPANRAILFYATEAGKFCNKEKIIANSNTFLTKATTKTPSLEKISSGWVLVAMNQNVSEFITANKLEGRVKSIWTFGQKFGPATEHNDYNTPIANDRSAIVWIKLQEKTVTENKIGNAKVTIRQSTDPKDYLVKSGQDIKILKFQVSSDKDVNFTGISAKITPPNSGYTYFAIENPSDKDELISTSKSSTNSEIQSFKFKESIKAGETATYYLYRIPSEKEQNTAFQATIDTSDMFSFEDGSEIDGDFPLTGGTKLFNGTAEATATAKVNITPFQNPNVKKGTTTQLFSMDVYTSIDRTMNGISIYYSGIKNKEENPNKSLSDIDLTIDGKSIGSITGESAWTRNKSEDPSYDGWITEVKIKDGYKFTANKQYVIKAQGKVNANTTETFLGLRLSEIKFAEKTNTEVLSSSNQLLTLIGLKSPDTTTTAKHKITGIYALQKGPQAVTLIWSLPPDSEQIDKFEFTDNNNTLPSCTTGTGSASCSTWYTTLMGAYLNNLKTGNHHICVTATYMGGEKTDPICVDFAIESESGNAGTTTNHSVQNFKISGEPGSTTKVIWDTLLDSAQVKTYKFADYEKELPFIGEAAPSTGSYVQVLGEQTPSARISNLNYGLHKICLEVTYIDEKTTPKVCTAEFSVTKHSIEGLEVVDSDSQTVVLSWSLPLDSEEIKEFKLTDNGGTHPTSGPSTKPYTKVNSSKTGAYVFNLDRTIEHTICVMAIYNDGEETDQVCKKVAGKSDSST